MFGRTYEGGQISYEKLYIFDEENRDIPSSAKSAMIQAMEQNDPVGIVAGYYDEKLTIWAAGSFFLENLGYSIENFRELTGGSLLKIIMDDSAYPFSPEVFRKMQGKTEYYMLTREGTPLFLRTVKSEAQDQHGRALWVLSTRISCGYAIYPDDSISMEELQIIADRRMYDNKAEHESELLGN